MNQTEFLEKVTELVGKGKANGGFITEAMLLDAFKEENMSGEQMLSIRGYITGNGVEIRSDGERPSSKIVKMAASQNVNNLEAQEKKVYKMYKDELAGIAQYEKQLEAELIGRKNAGDTSARQTLVEGNLRMVLDMAALYAGHGAPVADLVQEGNMALIIAVDEYEEGDFEAFLRERISNAMEMAVEDFDGNLAFKMHMADMANKIMDTSAELADDLGRQPTVEELAKELKSTADEIETVMKMSMDAMTMDEPVQDDTADDSGSGGFMS